MTPSSVLFSVEGEEHWHMRSLANSQYFLYRKIGAELFTNIHNFSKKMRSLNVGVVEFYIIEQLT